MTLRELMIKTLGEDFSCPDFLLDVKVYHKLPCKYTLKKYFKSKEFNVDICTSLIRVYIWPNKKLPEDFILVFQKFCGKVSLLIVPSEFVKE